MFYQECSINSALSIILLNKVGFYRVKASYSLEAAV